MINIRFYLKKYFKIFFYKIFSLIYGKVSYLKNNINKDQLAITKVKRERKGINYKIFQIKNSRLYTDRIQDAAIIVNNNLIRNASFQLRNNLNSDIKKNIVLKIGTPRILKKLNGNVLSLLTGGGGNNNYFHWMFDVLPRIGIIEKKINLNKIDYFLCPNLNDWQIRTLQLLGLNENKYLSSVDFRHISADNIIVTSHPWLHTKNIISDMENLPFWISKWLKKKFLKKKSKKSFPKKIYIDRGDSVSNLKDYRKIINEEEVVALLKKKGFESIQLSHLKFEEEIKLFNEAQAIVGLQGAGLTNLLWCNKDSMVIELRSKLTNKLYQNLAIQNKIKFRKIESKVIDRIIAKHYGSIKINIKALEKFI